MLIAIIMYAGRHLAAVSAPTSQAVDTIKLLLSAKGDPNAADSAGDTALALVMRARGSDGWTERREVEVRANALVRGGV